MLIADHATRPISDFADSISRPGRLLTPKKKGKMTSRISLQKLPKIMAPKSIRSTHYIVEDVVQKQLCKRGIMKCSALGACLFALLFFLEQLLVY